MLRKAATGSAKNITPKREKAASNDAGANGNTWASPWTKRSPWCPEFLRWATSNRGAERSMPRRSEEHTSELQSLMRISYAVFCLKKKKTDIAHKEKTSKQ